MIDASNRVRFVHPHMLLVEVGEPLALRFLHVVTITRIVVRHGGGVALLTDRGRFDAGSAFAIIQALVTPPLATRFAFTGPPDALRELEELCRRLWVEPDLAAGARASVREVRPP